MPDIARPVAEHPVASHTMMCSEIWSANGNVAHSVELPGLQCWVYSAPLELGQGGGDIHYLSACDNGALCRVALVDVSGHGRAVSAVADRLLGLMRTHVNQIEQRAFLRDLSGSLRRINGTDTVSFATALVVGFDSTSGTLLFTNAGHPPPLWYRADEARWSWLLPSSDDTGVGLPLGMDFFGSRYCDTVEELGVGDLLICYTDGLSEAEDSEGSQLGGEGLMRLAQQLPVESPMAAGATLLGLVDTYRRGTPVLDDETLLVLQRPRPTATPTE